DQQTELGLVQPQLLFDLHADDRKDRPHRETRGEGDGAEPKRGLRARRSACRGNAHVRPPIRDEALCLIRRPPRWSGSPIAGLIEVNHAQFFGPFYLLIQRVSRSTYVDLLI